jgi:hypothetical protein
MSLCFPSNRVCARPYSPPCVSGERLHSTDLRRSSRLAGLALPAPSSFSAPRVSTRHVSPPNRDVLIGPAVWDCPGKCGQAARRWCITGGRERGCRWSVSTRHRPAGVDVRHDRCERLDVAQRQRSSVRMRAARAVPGAARGASNARGVWGVGAQALVVPLESVGSTVSKVLAWALEGARERW